MDDGGDAVGHVSTRDLVHWESHPLALPITDQIEPSLGTGLCVFHDGTYFMYYIPHYRRGYFRDSPFQGDDVRVATSRNGIRLHKKPGPAVPFEYPTGGDVNPNVFPSTDPGGIPDGRRQVLRVEQSPQLEADRRAHDA